jgi:ketosteroid isomerase-like protein
MENTMATKTTPEEVVLAWNECFSRGDVKGSLEFMAEDFVRTGDWGGWISVNRKTWANGQKAFLAAWPDWTWELTNIVASGDWVVCEFEEHGTFTKPFELMRGIMLQPTNTSYEDHDCVLFRVNEDGLIAEIRAYITQNLEKEYHLQEKLIELRDGPVQDDQ